MSRPYATTSLVRQESSHVWVTAFLLLGLWITFDPTTTCAQQRTLPASPDGYTFSIPSFHQLDGLNERTSEAVASLGVTGGACSVNQLWRDDQWHNAFRQTTIGDETTLDGWDETTQAWHVQSRTLILRDGNNMPVLSQSYAWNGTDWINRDKQTSAFNEAGVLTHSLFEVWEEGFWQNRWRDERTYSGNQERWSQEIWDGTAWVFQNRSTVTKAITEENNRRVTLSSGFSEVWTDNTWVLAEEGKNRKTEHFSDNGNLLESLVEVENDADWINHTRDTYVYDERGNRTLWRSEKWDGNEWALAAASRQTYVYDEAGNIDIKTTEKWKQNPWTKEFEWVNDLRSLYSCASATSMDEAPQLSFRLNAAYPNPFLNTTTLSYTLDAPQPVTLHVYDALGRVVATLVDATQGAGEHHVRFDASGLSSGIYVYQLQAGTQAISKPLILMR